jgi:hypothetical protein
MSADRIAVSSEGSAYLRIRQDGGACRRSLPNGHLGDSQLRIRTEMNTTHKLDEVDTPEMTAKAWDEYLHRCGARAYISARYGSSVTASRITGMAIQTTSTANETQRHTRLRLLGGGGSSGAAMGRSARSPVSNDIRRVVWSAR